MNDRHLKVRPTAKLLNHKRARPNYFTVNELEKFTNEMNDETKEVQVRLNSLTYNY